MKPSIFTYYILIILQLSWYLEVVASNRNNRHHEIACNNFVTIKGSSNVNQFKFVNHDLHLSLRYDQSDNNTPSPIIKIPVDKFSGSNNRMLSDFHQLVNASAYPNITINIDHRKPLQLNSKNGKTLLQTEISIAGETQNYRVPCEISSCPTTGIVIKGEIEISLTDFNIDPPVKVLGAVRVNNQVFINFAFQLDSEEILTEKITR